MLIEKPKETSKFKSYGKCNLLRMRLCHETPYRTKNKVELKDYIDEIFAGLIWLG